MAINVTPPQEEPQQPQDSTPPQESKEPRMTNTHRKPTDKAHILHDRHRPRATAYRPATEKKGGSGKGNWGREEELTE